MSDERWATFDCYGTLIDWNEGIGGVLARLFGDEHRERLLARYHQLEPELERERYRTYREVLDLVVARIAEDEGRVLEPGERTAMSESLAEWPAFADVPDSLAQLRQRGWRLGILSNCDRDLVASSIPRLGVPFDEVVVAEDVHSYKPATGHWQEFRRRTGAEPASHVHVAQSLFHDIAPANELGLRSVWINRLAERPGPQPTRELPDLTGLADVLDDLVAR